MHVYREDSKRQKAGPVQWLGRLFMAALVLLGLASAVFLLFFRGYVVDTAEGRVLLLPFLAEEEGMAVFSGESVSLPEGDTLRESPQPLHAVLLPLETVADGSAAEKLRAAGGNALILDMKDESGMLHYVSALPEAIEARVSAADPERNEQLRALNRTDTYTIARVSCFRDDALAAARPDWALLRSSGSLWRDETRAAWLAAEETRAQDYILSVCRELAALGFDEVLLTDCHYPDGGRQDLLAGQFAQDAASRAAALSEWYTKLSTLRAACGLRISVAWAAAETETEGAHLSGQSLAELALAADRIFVPEGAAAAVTALAESGGAEGLCTFVSVSSAAGGMSASWAKF